MIDAAAGAAAARASWPRRLLRLAPLLVAVAALAVGTVALALITDGDPAAVAAPVLVTGALYAVYRLPLRVTALVLIFLLLGVDDFNTALGMWHTPWAIVNQILVYNVDRVFPQAHGFKLTGLELLILLGFGLAVQRRAAGNGVDGRGRTPAASIAVEFAVIYLLAIGYATVNGLLHGGTMDIAIWQARPLFHMVLLFFFFKLAFDGERDPPAVARVVVIAAIAKAILAFYVYLLFQHREQALACATSHGDSFLFVMGCVILVVHFAERSTWANLVLMLVVMPILFLGMYANNRRLAWVELAFALLAMLAVSRDTRWKSAIKRAGIVVLPVVALYLAAGWNSNSSIFAPVRIVRSVGDTKGDRSTYFRQVENFNLAMGMKFLPVRGLGFGREFAEYYPNDDITQFFPQYHAEPHNQVLGLFLFTGLIGFTALWSFLAVGVFLAVRSYTFATKPLQRALALSCFATIVVGLNDAYGDLGPYNTQHKVLMALALVLASKLAVVTGAWPRRVSRRTGLEAAGAAPFTASPAHPPT